jgi:hypothetical protein
MTLVPVLAALGLVFSLLAGAQPQSSMNQANDPNMAHPNAVVTVAIDGHRVSGLVTHLRDAKTFKHGIALFPGYPGILKLREQDSGPSYELRGNFLVRSRRHWLDAETLVIVLDAPSDQWASFTQAFRSSARYGSDIAALLAETGRRFGVAEWTLVGTSEGSISAWQAARMNPQLARRIILTASVFVAGPNGPGLSGVNWDNLPAPLLWVHHVDDPCRFTSYRDAQRFAEKSRSPLVTMRGGGPGRGEACEAFTAHGFVGVEFEAVQAMRAWVKSAALPLEASK